MATVKDVKMLKVEITSLPLRGYHVYKRELSKKIRCGDELHLKVEQLRYNGTSTFPVAAFNELKEKIGHIPSEYSWCFKVILREDNGRIDAKVQTEVPVKRKGEEIICNFIVHAPDNRKIRNALDNLYSILQESYWNYYKPSVVQFKKKRNKEVRKIWSLVTEAEDEQEQDNIPEELNDNPYTRRQFEKAILEGVERDRSLRIMVIGCHGQGKTSLVKKLLEEGVSNVDSTNGIDVIHFDVEEDFSWKRRTIVADADTEAARRLAAVDYLEDGQEKINMYKNTTKRRLRSSSLGSSEDGGTQENAKKMKVVASCSYSDQSLSQAETGQPSTFNSDIAIYKRYSSVMSNTSSEDMTGGSLIGSVWDFGGQYIFYSTHQLFHSRQAIYLLVFDLSLGLDTIIKDEDFPNKKNKKTLKDYIKFWVNSVHCFVGSNDGEEPHIILVGTHKDKLNVDEDVDDYFEDVRCIFDDSKQLRHIYSQHFAVSNIGPDTSDFLDLRKSITRLGKRLSEERAPLPARWILLEKSLKEKQHQKITSFDNILAINKEIQYPLAEEEEVKLFLQLHHARGSLFHFNDTELSSYVVLDPQYLIDAFKCIITSKKFCSTHTHLRKPWRRLCDDAILEKSLIEELWKRNPETNFLQHKDVLLGFLQRHRIIAQVQNFKGTKCSSSSPEVMDCYVVPSLLKVSSSSQLVSSFIKNNSMTQVALVYEFENDCIVETIFQRFTAAALGKWQPITFENQSLLFENLSVFEIRLDHAGMINFREGKLELLVVNLCPPEQVSSKDCDLFRCFFETVVSVEFQKLCADESGSQGKRKLFTNSVRCYNKDHELFGSTKVYRIAKIEEFAKSCIPCPDRRSHTFQARDVFDTWYNNYVEMEAVPKRLLTNKECGKLAAGIIGRGWEHLAYELGFSKVEVEHIDDDFKWTSTKILEVLTKWQQEQQDGATLDVLVSAIRKIQTPNLTIDEDKLKAIIYKLG